MARLTIDLQEGFQSDTVLIKVNDAPVYDKGGVTTRLQIGLADRIELPRTSSDTRIDVSLPEKGQRMTVVVPEPGTCFVGISLGRDGVLTSRLKKETFGYV